MVREMKILVYFVALTLLCLGAKADSKKYVWMSNEGKGDMVIRCTSGVTVFNKFLKPEEKTRWKLPAKSHTGICHVDIKGKGGGQGYLSVFVERECKSECKWRVFDGGIVKLRLASGVWKSFPLASDEESARRSCEDEDESPAPERHMVENEFDAKSLAPAPGSTVKYHKNREPELVKSPPPKNWEHIHGAPSPLPKNRENAHRAPPPLPRHVKSPPPNDREHTNGGPSPLPEHVPSRNREHIHVAPSPLKNREHTNGAPSPLPEHVKSPPPRNREHTHGSPSPSPGHVKNREEPSSAPSRPRDIESPSPEPTHWAPPPWDGDEETHGAPSPQPDKGVLPPLPQPGSTFYTCIKEGTD